MARAPEGTASGRDGGLTGRHSLAWRLILPVPIIIVLAIILIWATVPRIVASMAINDAVLANQQVAGEFKIIRTYYSDNIVNKVVKDGVLKATHDHKNNDLAIPLPADFVAKVRLGSGLERRDGLDSRRLPGWSWTPGRSWC
jgi:hypothetical protein